MRPADFIIYTQQGEPYLYRWWLIPRNRFLNIYLHKVVRDDDDRALHDHPWRYVSLILRSGYIEVTKKGKEVYRAPRILIRRATHTHRLVLLNENRPTWTIVFTGRKVREWGFHCPKGWVHWKIFTGGEDGKIRGGCEG